jgi:predicted phage baseplate assembly protein
MDDAGEATVVFGDGVFGKLPDVTSTVIASYRVGGGANGNLGPDSLVRPQPGESPGWFVSVTNPLPAQEGRDWESRDQARRVAPTGFQQPLVAVSAADFEAAADAFLSSNGSPAIQRANASFEWTGSWLTVKLTVDPLGAEGLTSGLRDQLAAYLNSRRLAGHDLEISPPAYVPIDLTIQVTVAVGSQPADVEQALRNVLGSGVLPDGSKGFFHPDNFTFGENLFVSRIFAAVMAVSGVQSANITVLARSHSAQPSQETAVNLSQGYLAVSNDEVIRLDNDRNFPQNGTLTITAAGAQS